MSSLTEGRLNFEFDTAVQAAQYDKWTYYRKHFSKISGMKAVDFVCYQAMEDTCWLIEVKDYRASTRTKPSELAIEITEKVVHTLAGLASARLRAGRDDERAMADAVLRCTELRVVVSPMSVCLARWPMSQITSPFTRIRRT